MAESFLTPVRIVAFHIQRGQLTVRCSSTKSAVLHATPFLHLLHYLSAFDRLFPAPSGRRLLLSKAAASLEDLESLEGEL